MESLRSDYQASKSGRFRRRRTGLMATGSGGDYHYRNVFDYLRMMEYARDMDRNDAVVGQMIDRAVLNTIQEGLSPDPKTKDKGLNTELKNRFNDWATDPQQCDLAGQMVFTDMEEQVLRSTFVDGDILALPLDDGPLQLIEAHRLRTPSGTQKNVVCGILLDDNRRRQEYWITKDDIDPLHSLALVGDVTKRPAFSTDEDTGEIIPNVFHIYNPKRCSQTRGVTALAPVFDMVGMHEDIQFAKLVQQQVASCFALIRERASDWKPGGVDPYGPQSNEVYSAMKRIVEDLAPGMEVRGLPGEKLTGFSPNIPNAEFFTQMRMILQLIGLNLGLPLVLLLMDASDTNFSGWRGAVDQARMGFRRNQRWLIDHFHTPVYQWKLRQFIREDSTLRARAAKMKGDFFKHQWNAPRWPYVQPLQDAQADQLRQKALLASPRRIQNERSQDWDDVTTEIVADNAMAIRKAIDEAKAITKDTDVPITWREVIFLTDPDLSKPITTAALPPPGNKKLLPDGTQPPASTDDAKSDPKDADDATKDPEDKPQKDN